MQIILVSRHLKAARTLTIMPRHIVLAFVVFFALIVSIAALFSWLSVQWRLPLVENLLFSVQQQESRKVQDYVSNNLNLMATRLGELQGKMLHLDSLGERVAALAGGKPELGPKEKAGQGGPYLPVTLSVGDMQYELENLATAIDDKTDELNILASRLLEKRVAERLLPTTLPVKNSLFGSPYGHRADPIAGRYAMHEGIDFVADTGTPVVAAADGVVVAAEFHPQFGNMIDIDHGQGLSSRYAHLSRVDVRPGTLIKHGTLLGAVGNTGRSTGPHLHFEVRMHGVAQNPAAFLKQGSEFAQLKRR